MQTGWSVTPDAHAAREPRAEPHAPLTGSARIGTGCLDVSRQEIRVRIHDALVVPAFRQKTDHGLRSDARSREGRLVTDHSPPPLDLAFTAPLAKVRDVSFQRASDLTEGHGEFEDDLAGCSCAFEVALRSDVHDLVIGQKREPDFGERRVEVKCRLESAQRLERQPIAKLCGNAKLDEIAKAVQPGETAAAAGSHGRPDEVRLVPVLEPARRQPTEALRLPGREGRDLRVDHPSALLSGRVTAV